MKKNDRINDRQSLLNEIRQHVPYRGNTIRAQYGSVRISDSKNPNRCFFAEEYPLILEISWFLDIDVIVHLHTSSFDVYNMLISYLPDEELRNIHSFLKLRNYLY